MSRLNRPRTLAIAVAAVAIAALVVSPAIGGPSLKKLVKTEVAKQLAGKTGPQGAQGAQGAQGPAGTSALTLRACVNSNGTTCAGTSTGVGVTHTAATGTYNVDFGQSLVNCSAMANLGQGNAGEIATTPLNPNNNSVQVQTRDSTGAPSDLVFRMVVVC